LLGEYGLLPLLKGWEYKRHMVSRSNIVRGADPVEVLSLNETGWLYSVAELTTDTYGTMRFNYQGAELESKTLECIQRRIRLGALLAKIHKDGRRDISDPIHILRRASILSLRLVLEHKAA